MDASVPIAAVERLLDLLAAQGVSLPADEDLFSAQRCAPFMRDFKLDISVSLRDGGAPRASVNDTGEPDAFRQRLRAQPARLGLSAETLETFLSRCPPRMAQTTLSLKWEQRLRTTLYFEELPRHPDPEGLCAALFSTYAVPAPRPGRPLMAIATDFIDGEPAALKVYRHIDLQQDPSAAPALAPMLRRHPRTGQRRAMLAERFGMDGRLRGDKLLWVTEANTPALAAQTWRHVSRLARRLSFHRSTGWALTKALVGGWPFGPGCVPYPDLVCFNRALDGAIEDLILYISLK
ncbi:MAG: hypothetical protein AAFV53_06160 [Myxococcota bacterium]